MDKNNFHLRKLITVNVFMFSSPWKSDSPYFVFIFPRKLKRDSSTEGRYCAHEKSIGMENSVFYAAAAAAVCNHVYCSKDSWSAFHMWLTQFAPNGSIFACGQYRITISSEFLCFSTNTGLYFEITDSWMFHPLNWNHNLRSTLSIVAALLDYNVFDCYFHLCPLANSLSHVISHSSELSDLDGLNNMNNIQYWPIHRCFIYIRTHNGRKHTHTHSRQIKWRTSIIRTVCSLFRPNYSSLDEKQNWIPFHL